MQANWLNPLLKALDEAPTSVEFFLRDDDAGWDDDRLIQMLEVVGGHALPIDLAVIPRAVGSDLALQLSRLHAQSDGRLGLHQHGLAHHNHEPHGRKCEFGPSRGTDAQRRDMLEGRDLLESLLPGITQPVFTPPWNRCQRATAELLADLGYRVLSRHADDARASVGGLIELPVSVDWSYARRDGRRLSFTELGALAGERAALGQPVGINLHHAVMDRGELELLDDLCAVLAGHGAARCRPLFAIATGAGER
ncbi:MAG TPA: hypothetical protein VFI54_11770 [Solirubrobacteraceae bacterium]|nr:hypothetical protein [Solirubrobacteraceae bacterium]